MFEDLLDKNGNISSQKLKSISGEKLDSIKLKTEFLSHDATITERVYCIKNNILNKKMCKCGSELRFYSFKTGYADECKSCSQKNPERIRKIQEFHKNNKEKISEKRKQTCLARYGVNTPFQSNEIQNKIKKAVKTKYNVENISQLQEVKDKKVGRCGNPEKVKETALNKRLQHPAYSLLENKEWLEEQYKNKTIVQIGEELNIAFSTINNYLIKHDIARNNWTFSSSYEKLITEFLDECNIKYEVRNRSIIAPKELDFYIPDKNLAIEINGEFWHSNLEEDYHLNKTVECANKGIQLLHIFDFEIDNKFKLVKSLLKAKLGIIDNKIYARKCNLSEIDADIGFSFIEANHMQGGCQSGNYYGAFFDGKLVSVLQIAKPRFNKKYDFEILRFCNLVDTTIIGGFSRLFSFASETGSFVSYANRRWSSGNMYSKSGFSFVKHSEPNYWYYRKDKRISRYSAQKHKLHKLLDNFDYTKTEKENMMLNGFRIVHDSGNSIFTINK